MNWEWFTLLHTVISLGGIAAGFGMLFGMIHGRHSNGWTAMFLATTMATSLSGFAFPATAITPGHIVGAISLITLSLAMLALYHFGLEGSWRRVFVINAVASLYFNVFVGFAQSFQKVPAMKALAPTQSEAPFALVQAGVLVLFLYLGRRALQGFQEAKAMSMAARA